MSVEKRAAGAWRVRWREGDAQRQRTFRAKRDADLFEADIVRRQRLGNLAQLDAGRQTLDAYVRDVWAPTFAATLAEKTRRSYASLYGHHIAPTLGGLPLRSITPELIARWQADRLAAGSGPVAVAKAFTLLGSILQRAAEGQHITSNPARVTRKARTPRRAEVRPLAPVTVEAMRAASAPRDAALLSVLAYAGLRPGEALALRWGDVRERTILVQRAVSLGTEKDTKTAAHRTVRLLTPLAQDLREWKMSSGRPRDDALVFPGVDGRPWTEPAYQSWRRAAAGTPRYANGKPGRPAGPFARALDAAGTTARPYDLRHSFASLLIHEGRSVIYVARQLGHNARLTLDVYGHVIDELEDAPQVDAETAITDARSARCGRHVGIAPTATA